MAYNVTGSLPQQHFCSLLLVEQTYACHCLDIIGGPLFALVDGLDARTVNVKQCFGRSCLKPYTQKQAKLAEMQERSWKLYVDTN